MAIDANLAAARPATRRPRAALGVAFVMTTAVAMSSPTVNTTAQVAVAQMATAADAGRVAAGAVLRVNVPEAFGSKTVIGQLTVDQAIGPGFVTAYGCDGGIPRDDAGNVARSDLNFDSRVSTVASNRLIVQADDNGDVCFYTLSPAALIVDVNAVSFDTGITSFPNRRTDTRIDPGERVAAGGVLRVSVPEAVGGRTVIGQLTVDQAIGPGFVTAYGCDAGIPRDAVGNVNRSDLNYDSRIAPFASNRLVVQADDDGDVCFHTLAAAALIVDVNGVSDRGIDSFPNQRTDTRSRPFSRVEAGDVLRVNVPQAAGAKTVVGQLTVDQAAEPGFVTAYGCDDGLPTDADGTVTRSDLNYDSAVAPFASNRLVVQADDDGDICFYTLAAAALIVDINGVSDVGISSFPNQRTDMRVDPPAPGSGAGDSDGVPVWPPYEALPPLDGVAALTGVPAGEEVTSRPILAVKIDNYWRARPQFGLDQADAIIEENVEGVTRFIALFHSHLPVEVGPVRSARTGDLDLLAAMNRPVFAYSGANPGVTQWIDSAAGAGVLEDFTAQRQGCYRREATRPGPHNLLLDPVCAVTVAASAGPARPLWQIDPSWTVPAGAAATADDAFGVTMDGVQIEWVWDAATATYLRFQDGVAHVAANGWHIAAANVVEIAAVHVPSPVDARSPNPITVGTGAAIVHRNGIAIPAVWSRATPYDPFQFFDTATGAPIPLATGTTFVELTRAAT